MIDETPVLEKIKAGAKSIALSLFVEFAKEKTKEKIPKLISWSRTIWKHHREDTTIIEMEYSIIMEYISHYIPGEYCNRYKPVDFEIARFRNSIPLPDEAIDCIQDILNFYFQNRNKISAEKKMLVPHWWEPSTEKAKAYIFSAKRDDLRIR